MLSGIGMEQLTQGRGSPLRSCFRFRARVLFAAFPCLISFSARPPSAVVPSCPEPSPPPPCRRRLDPAFAFTAVGSPHQTPSSRLNHPCVHPLGRSRRRRLSSPFPRSCRPGRLLHFFLARRSWPFSALRMARLALADVPLRSIEPPQTRHPGSRLFPASHSPSVGTARTVRSSPQFSLAGRRHRHHRPRLPAPRRLLRGPGHPSCSPRLGISPIHGVFYKKLSKRFHAVELFAARAFV